MTLSSSWSGSRRWLLVVALAVVIASVLILAVSNWGGGAGDDKKVLKIRDGRLPPRPEKVNRLP